MNNYTCDRCNYNTTNKTNYITHINRKNICKSIDDNSNVDIYQLYKKYNIQFDENKISPLWKEYIKTTDIETINMKKYVTCQYCAKKFSRNTSLVRHKQKCINHKKLLIELEKNNKELEDSKKELIQIKDKLNTIEPVNNTTITNNNTSNNTTINANNNNIIMINNYGTEDTSYISKDQLKQYALNIPDGINQLAEQSHFSPQHLENKNIRIEDKNDKLIQIWKDNKWIYKNRNKLIDHIIFAKYAILGDILAEMETNNEISEFKLELLTNIKDKYVDDDLFFEQIQKEIEMIILNNSTL